MDNKTINIISQKINFKKIKKSKIKNILITGCSGFIGSYIINSLLNNKENELNIYGLDIVKTNILEKNSSFHFY